MNQIINQTELFAQSRWPKKPYCTDDLSAGIRIRSLKQALTKQYIQANPPHLRVWSIYDLDYAGAALAWEDQNLPPPAWAAINKQNAHAHCVWGLRVPVLLEADDARRAPMRYLAAVESAFSAKLKADTGYSGLITKNPANPHWRLLQGPPAARAYDLSELAEYVDISKHALKQGFQPAQFGLGRNCSLFDSLRKYSYKQIRHYKNFVLWQSHLNNKALEMNADFMQPLMGNEVWQIAKSIAKWTWNKFDIAASDKRFSELQSFRVQLRWGGNEDKQASARLMRAKGMSLGAIAEELQASKSTVHKWCA